MHRRDTRRRSDQVGDWIVAPGHDGLRRYGSRDRSFGKSCASRAGAYRLLQSATDFGLTKNGAGCEPDCRKTALTTMIALAATAARMANESHRTPRRLGPQPKGQCPAGTRYARMKTCSALRRLRTFLHRKISNALMRRRIFARCRGARRRRRCPDSTNNSSRREAAARQSSLPARARSQSSGRLHGDARTLADPAADGKFAAVQSHQTLDDGETEPSAAMAAVVGAARAWKYGSPTRGRSSSLMPTPLSSTANGDMSPPRRAR